MGDAAKVLRSASKHGARGGTISVGKGTISGLLLDVLGLSESRKEIVSIVIENDLTSDMLRGISRDMQFHKANHGIAFSCAVSEFIGGVNSVDGSSEDAGESLRREVKSSVYKIIHVIVDKGKGAQVIDAANKAGARGGTIINARGAASQEAKKYFSIEIEPEKEEVLIIANSEVKNSIVQAVRERMQIDKPGKGIIFVLDVNEVYGLHEG